MGPYRRPSSVYLRDLCASASKFICMVSEEATGRGHPENPVHPILLLSAKGKCVPSSCLNPFSFC